MQNALSNHPFYTWLINDPSIYSWKDFNKHIQHIDKYSLNQNEIINLVNVMVSYLNKLSEYIMFFEKEDYLKELTSSILDEKNQPTNLLLSYYLICMNLDTNKKSSLWHSNSFPIIEHISLGKEFLVQYNPEYFTKSIYRTKACEYTIELIIKNEVLFLHSNNLSNIIDTYSDKIKTYNKKTNWNHVLKKTPSFLLSLIAQKQGYQLNDQQVFNVFHYLYQKIYSSSFDKNKIKDLATLFSEFLCNTSLFKHTLSHTNQVHTHVAKFFKVAYKEPAYHKHEEFANFVISFKGFDKDNLANKLEKLQHFKLMGKHYLNSDEKKQFEQLKEKTKSIPTKRTKI